MKLLYLLIIPILFITLIEFADSVQTTEFSNIKIIEKQQQQIIKEHTTEYRYLIITDKGTFICESSLLQGKFNNSDIYWRIKKDSTYSYCKVAGVGKSFFFDYQNILEIK